MKVQKSRVATPGLALHDNLHRQFDERQELQQVHKSLSSYDKHVLTGSLFIVLVCIRKDGPAADQLEQALVLDERVV
jgi:hypothetical protein